MLAALQEVVADSNWHAVLQVVFLVVSCALLGKTLRFTVHRGLRPEDVKVKGDGCQFGPDQKYLV